MYISCLFSGKVYSVINRRNGKVLEAVGMDENEKVFLVKAELPVISSIGFATEIRKATSGQAMPNMKFDRYEVSFSMFLTIHLIYITYFTLLLFWKTTQSDIFLTFIYVHVLFIYVLFFVFYELI